ncbi:regulatory protein RecX [Vallitalea pronyensis]|uniref:Regulatory protein RecX n=1 Tax=Vallitalea pronyensis TaxID=1348613 RepID=A0A8J8MJZ1_9FIRM|nr:regulatory protein RecX [Vallitalea pronyensis]QUI23045.1 regulatory protein RecX [Vallitalea pronyensis]
MIITDIQQNKRFKNYLDIYLDHEYAFFLTNREIKYLKLNKGDQIMESSLNNIYRDYVYPRARNRAFRLLQRRDMTKLEMVNKLKLSGNSPVVIDYILSLLEEYHYIDDDAYANKYISYNKERKSILQMKMELGRKGVPKDIIVRHLEDAHVCEEKVAYALLEKKYKNQQQMDEKIKKRMMGFLLRKGYPYHLVNKVICHFIEQKY